MSKENAHCNDERNETESKNVVSGSEQIPQQEQIRNEEEDNNSGSVVKEEAKKSCIEKKKSTDTEACFCCLTFSQFIQFGSKAVLKSRRGICEEKHLLSCVEFVPWVNGTLKGLGFSSNALVAQANNLVDTLKITKYDKIACLYPFQSAASRAVLLASVFTGCTLQIIPEPLFPKRLDDFSDICKAFSIAKCTIVIAPPRIWEQLAIQLQNKKTDGKIITRFFVPEKKSCYAYRDAIKTFRADTIRFAGCYVPLPCIDLSSPLHHELNANGRKATQLAAFFRSVNLDLHILGGFEEAGGICFVKNDRVVSEFCKEIRLKKDEHGRVKGVCSEQNVVGYVFNGERAAQDVVALKHEYAVDERRSEFIVTSHGDYVDPLWIRSRILANLSEATDVRVVGDGNNFIAVLVTMGTVAESQRKAIRTKVESGKIPTVVRQVSDVLKSVNSELLHGSKVHKFGVRFDHCKHDFLSV